VPGSRTDLPVIPVLTKADRRVPGDLPAGTVVTSSSDGRGLPRLWSALAEAVRGYRLNEAVAMGVVLNERHLHKLQECRGDLRELLTVAEADEVGSEVVGTMLSSILSRFGEISGRVFSEQLLESIFSRFCVGK
jgi:tRNA modification GTPase